MMTLVRFQFVDDDGASVDFTLSRPPRPWRSGSRGVGGREFSAARVPSSYEIRRDRTLRLPLRVTEAEWPMLLKTLEHGGRSTAITITAGGVSRTCYLLEPQLSTDGGGIEASHSEFPGDMEIETLWVDTADVGWAATPSLSDMALLGVRRGQILTPDFFHSRADASPIATYVDRYGVIQTVDAPGDLRDRHWIDGARHTLLEPSRANKCQYNYNYGTNGTTGWTTSGDAAGVLSVVDHASLLADAGLDSLVTDGRVLKLDNSGGTTPFHVIASGVTGNTNPHSISAWLRGTGSVSFAGVSSASVNGELAYRRVRSENVTPASSTISLRVTAPAGQTVYVVLPQMEEGAFATSEILTQGATVTRGVDIASMPMPDAVIDPRTPWVRYTRYVAGMAGNGGIGNAVVNHIGAGAASSTSARLALYWSGSTTLALRHGNGSANDSAFVVHAVARGDRVETLIRWKGDGTATLIVAVDGSIVGTATLSGIAPPSAWNGGATAYLNSRNGGSGAGAMALLDDLFLSGDRSDRSAASLLAEARSEARAYA